MSAQRRASVARVGRAQPAVLTDAMAATLGERVRLGQRVQAIEMDARGVSVRCAGGTRYRAKFALAGG